jgi:hypothetical protein
MPGRGFSVVLLFLGVLLAGCRDAPQDTSQPLAPTPLGEIELPAPAPAADLTPTPSPPAAKGCQLPPGTGSGRHCPREHSSFLAEVEGAMDRLIHEEPEIFDLPLARGCPNCYRVLNTHRLTLRMTQILEERGLCTRWDGEELAVKNTNAWNDQYDILTAEMYLRRQEGSYRSTCYPAWF